MGHRTSKYILVTGGAGYIGSHAAVALHQAGYAPVLFDNLSNSSIELVHGVQALCGGDIPFIQGDIRSEQDVTEVFKHFDDQGTPILGLLHFAAHKFVGESVSNPAKYASNNVGGLGTILEVASRFDVRNIVFSSSCTVYGEPNEVPVDESAPFQFAESPYGWTKQASERVLEDHALTHPSHRIALLRYFNPIGAHESALIGELPNGVPNNLIPFLTQTACGLRQELTVFGDDYPTEDGTCIRDYLHVMDLAEAHVRALDWCLYQKDDKPVVRAFNLGTGQGASVLDIVRTFELATGVQVPVRMGPRRAGDVVAIWANPERAERELKWKAHRSLALALTDAWRWQQRLTKT